MSYIGRQPTAAALTSSDITDGIITEAKMADDAISITELKAGTDGNIISYDASGNPVAIATGSDGQVLTSAGAGQPPAFEAGGLTGVTTGSGHVTITDGNLILGTSGKGIDFSAHGQAAGMTGELLDDFEEGTFTGTIGGGTFTYTRNTGYYRKIGDLVYVQIYMTIDAYSSGSRVNITGLPYTSRVDHADGRYPISVGRISDMRISTIAIYPFIHSNGVTIGCDGMAASADVTTNNLGMWDDDTQMSFGGCYLAA